MREKLLTYARFPTFSYLLSYQLLMLHAVITEPTNSKYLSSLGYGLSPLSVNEEDANKFTLPRNSPIRSTKL